MIEELRKDGGEIRRLSKQEPSPLAKIATGAEPDRLKLMFLPLMNSTKSVSEQTKAAIKLSKQSNLPGEQLISLISAIIVLADKILTKEDINDIWEEISMLKVIQFAEEKGMEKGVEKGMEKGVGRGMQDIIYKQLLIKFQASGDGS